MRTTPLLSAVASLTLLLTACGGEASDDDAKADLIEDLSQTLQGEAVGFDKEAADCYAAVVVDEVGVEALKDVDLSADEPPRELQDEIVAAATRGAEECDLPEPKD
jgi:hypothetical protein